VFINSLHDLIHFLKDVVRGRIPYQTYRHYIRSTVALQDRLQAYQRSLSAADKPQPLQDAAPTEITIDLLAFYTNLGFPDKYIAVVLGTSRSTITRRRKDLGVQRRAMKHQIAQNELEAVSHRDSP
jgi:hypothetical protein